MIIEDNTPREYVRAWAIFLGCYGALYAITVFLGRFADAPWDINLLLLLNPDAYIPGLDEAVILVTDFSTYYFCVLLLAWQVGYYCSRENDTAQDWVRYIFYALAAVFGVWHSLGVIIQERGIFWWSEYEYAIVFLPLGIAFAAGFVVAGNLFMWLDDDDQRKLAHAFWLTLLAVFFVNFIGEDFIKEIVARHRPLHSTYEAWNHQARIIPDEVVRGSYSYISGHTSSFWALVTVYFWLFRNTKIRVGLALWALFHGYTRIYTAAHFPYCCIMATFFAFPVTSLMYYCLWNHRALSLLAMTGLAIGLYLFLESPLIAATFWGVSVAWFLVYHYVLQGAPDAPEPMDAAITFPN